MIEQRAQIIAQQENFYIVEAVRNSGCAKCDAGEGCGGGVFRKWLPTKRYRLKVAATMPAQPQQWVRIGLADEQVLRWSLWLYGVPLCCMMLSIVILATLQLSELSIIVAAIVAFFMGSLLARWRLSRLALPQADLLSVIANDDLSCSRDASHTEIR